mgnify:CR=1 FL=1
MLFQNLKDRGLSTPRLIISDAHSGLVSAIRASFPGASWQRCKVHFMRNILAYVPQKENSAIYKKIYSIYCQFGDMMGQDGKHLFDELTVLKTEMNK